MHAALARVRPGGTAADGAGGEHGVQPFRSYEYGADGGAVAGRSSEMIIESSLHRIVRAEALTLPRGNGDRDTEIEFFVSVDANLKAPDKRPLLLYRVNLQGDEPVHLVMRINGDAVADHVVRDTYMQTFHEVLDDDTLRTGGNTLVIRVPDDQPGTVVVSQVVVVFAVHFLIPTADDDDAAPTGGPL